MSDILTNETFHEGMEAIKAAVEKGIGNSDLFQKVGDEQINVGDGTVSNAINVLGNLVTINPIASEPQQSLSIALKNLLNNDNFPAGKTITLQFPCLQPVNSWYIAMLTRTFGDTYSGFAYTVSDYAEKQAFIISGYIGNEPNVAPIAIKPNRYDEYTDFAHATIAPHSFSDWLVLNSVNWDANRVFVPRYLGQAILLNYSDRDGKVMISLYNMHSDSITVDKLWFTY